MDKPALSPLPTSRDEFAEFPTPRANIDYHIEVEGHYYSVPYELKGQKMDVRLTVRVVQVLHRNRRGSSHVRDDRKPLLTLNRPRTSRSSARCILQTLRLWLRTGLGLQRSHGEQ